MAHVPVGLFDFAPSENLAVLARTERDIDLAILRPELVRPEVVHRIVLGPRVRGETAPPCRA